MYGLGDLITMRHLDDMAKVMLAPGDYRLLRTLFEAFIGWYYAGIDLEIYAIWNRLTGPYRWTYYGLIFRNLVVVRSCCGGRKSGLT